MTKKINPEKFRLSRANELRQLEDTLSRLSPCILNAEILKSAAARCTTSQPHGKNSWGYEIENLLFRVNKPQKTLPNFPGDNLIIKLGVDISGSCIDIKNSIIETLTVNIEIYTENRSHLCTWHLDRHISEAGDNETGEAHPLFHFQYGGHAMRDSSCDFGQTLLIPAPRLPSPPMDAILAIDFILSNFSGDDWKRLKLDGTYKNKVADAQSLYWQPYIEKIASWWSTEKRHNYDSINELWPHLI